MNLTVDVVTRLAVIDAVPIADIEPGLGAVPPDRMLHEPRKHRRERRVESPGVDPLGHSFNDLSAAAWPVAGRAIGMGGAEPAQDAGAVQKVVNQVSMAIMLAPTSGHSRSLLGAPSRRDDKAMVSTLSETP